MSFRKVSLEDVVKTILIDIVYIASAIFRVFIIKMQMFVATRPL